MAVFSKEIDLSKITQDLEKPLEPLKKLSKISQKATTTLNQGFGNKGVKSLQSIARMFIVIKEVIEKIVATLGKIIFVLLILEKLNPFKWLAGAISGLADVSKKIFEIANGSLEKKFNAFSSATTKQQYAAVQKASEYGTPIDTRTLTNLINRITRFSADSEQDFAILELNRDALIKKIKNNQGVDVLKEVIDKIVNLSNKVDLFDRGNNAIYANAIQNLTGLNENEVRALTNTIQNFTKSNNKDKNDLNKTFWEKWKIDYENALSQQVESEALESFENTYKKMQEAWDSLIKTLKTQFAPILEDVVKWFTKLINNLKDFINSDFFKAIVRKISTFIDKFVMNFNKLLNKLVDAINWFSTIEYFGRKIELFSPLKKIDNDRIKKYEAGEQIEKLKNITNNNNFKKLDDYSKNIYTKNYTREEFKNKYSELTKNYNNIISEKELMDKINTLQKLNDRKLNIKVEAAGDTMYMSINDGVVNLVSNTVIGKFKVNN